MLMGALESGSDALMRYVFETAHVLSWLVDAPTEVSPPSRGGSVANGMSRQPLRAGVHSEQSRPRSSLVFNAVYYC